MGVVDELLLLEPESNLLLGGLDGVRAVADVASDILEYVSIFPCRDSSGTYNGVVTTDGARGGGEGVGGTEDD